MRREVSLAFTGIVFWLLAAVSFAQSPREHLNQLITQLRASPGDGALRERIIRLAQEIKPSPVVPEEAERRMVRGAAAFRDAKDESGYRAAAREFEQAIEVVPWYGDAYFNLGVSLDKAGDHAGALRSLKLARLASPESKEVRTLLYEVEYRAEKATSSKRDSVRKEATGASLSGGRFAKRMTYPAGIFETAYEVDGYEVRQRSTLLQILRPDELGHLRRVGDSSVSGRYVLRGREFIVSDSAGHKEVGRFSDDGRLLVIDRSVGGQSFRMEFPRQ